ncbi:MAG TPA: hypothetical protein VIO33_05575 [Burkholderiaceae bacterium]
MTKMRGAASDRARWCEVFSTLYRAHEHCSGEDARLIARMLYPSLGLLRPAEALQTLLSSDRICADALTDAARRGNGGD